MTRVGSQNVISFSTSENVGGATWMSPWQQASLLTMMSDVYFPRLCSRFVLYVD